MLRVPQLASPAPLSLVCHLLPAAHHTSVLLVGAVMCADISMGALQQCLLLPGALDIIQENAKGGPFPKFCLLAGPHHVGEAQLAAHHSSCERAPAIVTHCAPLTIDVNLHPALATATALLLHQPHSTVLKW